LLIARWWLEQGKVEESLYMLEQLVVAAREAGRIYWAFEMQVVMVLAYAADKQVPEARQKLLALLEQAHIEGYLRLFQSKCHPEVEGECLRLLAKAPEGIVGRILSHYTTRISVGTGTPVPRHETKGDVVLLGLFDLLLAYAKESACLSFIEAFLHETQRYDIYHYVLTTIIANHSSEAWNLLLKVAQDEREPEKVQLLLSALTLVPHDPAIEKVIRELQQKIA
jgi:hypothetical protein